MSHDEAVGARIIVGIKFDKFSQNLIDAACDLSMRLKAAVKLVHIIELDRQQSYRSLSMSESSKEDQDRDLGLIQIELNRMKSIFMKRSYSEIETLVLRGDDPADLLLSEALASSSTLIMVSNPSHVYEWLPSEYSVVLKLASQSSIPLLVMKTKEAIPFSHDIIKLLVMDDFTPEFAIGLKKCRNFILNLGRVQVLHVHAKESTVHRLVSPLASLDDEAPLPPAEVLKRWEDICSQLSRDLRSRWASIIADSPTMSPPMAYDAQVVTDRPIPGILAIVESFKPDMTIMGHSLDRDKEHQHIHRLSLAKMLNKGNSLMLIAI